MFLALLIARFVRSSVCAVCASGYGSSAGYSCHECTESFKIGIYVVVILAVIVIITMGVLLAIYLVSRRLRQ